MGDVFNLLWLITAALQIMKFSPVFIGIPRLFLVFMIMQLPKIKESKDCWDGQIR
jgi:hypothetical protein